MSSKTSSAHRSPHNHAAAPPTAAAAAANAHALKSAQLAHSQQQQSQPRSQHPPPHSQFSSQQQQQHQPPQPLVIYPSVGLGPFRLGASIGAVLSLLQSSPSLTAGGPPSATTLTGSATDPASVDLSLELRSLGVRLRFDAEQQRLHLIDVFDATRATLVYMRTPLTSPAGNGAPPTFTQLSRLFGPTYPGSWTPHDEDDDAEDQKRGGSGGGNYTLQYPGVAMVFPLSSSPLVSAPGASASSPQQQQQPQHSEVVVEMPDGSSPPLARLFIHAGPVLSDYASALPALSAADSYFEPLTVVLGRGIYFERRACWVSFDSRAQDLIALLGPPQHLYVKDEAADKMMIHRGSAPASQSSSPLITGRTLLGSPAHTAASGRSRVGSAALGAPPHTSDYFFNYFLLGFDALLDGATHRVKKIVLHTNWMDRPDFARYARANFGIHAPGSAGTGAGAEGKMQQRGGGGGGGGPSLLELPPTAVQRSHSGSMLHPSTSLDSLPPLGSSPPQSISIPIPSADAAGGADKKKKKKKTGALAAAAAAAAEAKEDGGDGVASSSAPSQSFLNLPPPSPSPVTFSPSLSPSVLPMSQATVITAVSKWSDVLSVLGPCALRPMVSSASPSDNPFSPTYFYAYRHVIFEVMRNHQLASVTLFRATQD